mmetsp:Transcript_29442/g.95871  ORF Transcript_29442/g.95871 Transcript_29442/m.95871 type:complete len:411 (-) Transcript_29442:736-1968(-)
MGRGGEACEVGCTAVIKRTSDVVSLRCDSTGRTAPVEPPDSLDALLSAAAALLGSTVHDAAFASSGEPLTDLASCANGERIRLLTTPSVTAPPAPAADECADAKPSTPLRSSAPEFVYARLPPLPQGPPPSTLPGGYPPPPVAGPPLPPLGLSPLAMPMGVPLQDMHPPPGSPGACLPGSPMLGPGSPMLGPCGSPLVPAHLLSPLLSPLASPMLCPPPFYADYPQYDYPPQHDYPPHEWQVAPAMEQLLPAPEPPAQWPISPEASARRSEEEHILAASWVRENERAWRMSQARVSQAPPPPPPPAPPAPRQRPPPPRPRPPPPSPARLPCSSRWHTVRAAALRHRPLAARPPPRPPMPRPPLGSLGSATAPLPLIPTQARSGSKRRCRRQRRAARSRRRTCLASAPPCW